MTTQIHHTPIDQEQWNTIGITPKAITALKRLRQEWQEDAGTAYPQDVLPQLLVLYDVCKGLDLNLFEANAILGKVGVQAVKAYINAPACQAINIVKALETLHDKVDNS